MNRAELESLDREGLVARAQALGIRRARILTRPELVDELLRLDPEADEAQLRRSRGFFGVARDLLTRVVERGLHLPDAAERLRAALGNPLPEVPRPEPQALPTVTLAEIYAAQGHKARAIETLERVLEREPDHAAAQALLDRLRDVAYVAPKPVLPPEPEVEEPPPADEEEEEEQEIELADADLEPLAPVEPLEPLEPIELVEDAVTAVLLPPGQSPPPAECVAIPGDGTMFVWWRCDRSVLRGPFVIRVLVLVPTWDGPREEVRDLRCAPEASEHTVPDVPERSVVRVAIGFVDDGGRFVPVAQSPALELARHDGGLVRWTLDGLVPVVLDDPRSASIARAVQARRLRERTPEA